MGIGSRDVADRLAAELDAVAGGAVGMVEQRGAQGHPRMRRQNLPGAEIVEADSGLEDLQRHRVERRHHQVGQHAAQGHLVLEMAGPHAHGAVGAEQRREERQPADMIEMRMGEEDVEIVGTSLRQIEPQSANAGAGVEDQTLVAARDLETRRVAAVADIVRAGTRDRSTRAPETDREIGIAGCQLQLLRPRPCASNALLPQT